MTRKNHHRALVLMRIIQIPCRICGHMSVAVCRRNHYCEGSAFMNAIQLSQRALCAALAILTLTLNVSAQEYFVDDFSDGNADDGMPVTWSPWYGSGFDASSGDYEWTPIDTNMGATVNEHIYEDVSLQTQVTLSGPNGGMVFITARGNNQFAYYAGIRPGSGDIGIWDASKSDWNVAHSWDTPPFLELPQSTDLDVISNDIRMQFDLLGDTLTFAAWTAGDPRPETPQIVVSADSFSTGSVGLFHNHWGSGTTATFRWFAALPVLASPCDLNNDGVCTVDDINLLNAVGDLSVGVSMPVANPYDINGDNTVDRVDLDLWLADAAKQNGFPAPYLHGDANLDSTVDAADLNALALSWRRENSAWSAGDFTADGVVDALDLNQLALNWQRSIPVAAAQSVPEPSTIFLSGLAAAVALMLSRSSIGLRRTQAVDSRFRPLRDERETVVSIDCVPVE